MFNRIGLKIQNVAKIFAWIGIIFSVVFGLVLLIFGALDPEQFGILIVLGPIIAFIGCFFSWLSVLVLYGFGKLVEDVEAIKNGLNQKTTLKKKTIFEDNEKTDTTQTRKARMCTEQNISPERLGNGYICPSCKTIMDVMSTCEKCGYIPPKN